MERFAGFRRFLPVSAALRSGFGVRSMEKPVNHVLKERTPIERREDEVTVDSDASFPASDPPSFNPGTTGAPGAKKKKR
jgi:hypothetical protein